METSFRTKVPELDISMSFTYTWDQPPNGLDLNTGQIHIWKVKLNEGNPHVDYLQTLSADEQLRAERMILPQKRERFQRARSALRRILSIYMNQPPESIHFKYRPKGKPYLLQISRQNSIEFNIAHSENLMVAAFTKCIPVGIDLEFNQPLNTKDWIVKRYFSKNDQVVFNNIPEKDKETAFLSAWTKKEAHGKAVGIGLASLPQMNQFEPGLNIALSTGHYEIVLDSSFWFLRFTPEENFTAIAAVRSRDKPKPYFWIFLETSRNNQF